ncbi:PatB family C-S lyase [Psychrosphaera sp. B3R10]|uniref:MalY/PatB family protein n=1 Tax=unclassified Psychrosphaera TaxID=2641570 RepID=UPI001C08EB12|nr:MULTISPECIES: PatB family C-S lyase [unclassified Psychrosphaera]MBU2881798.1 PatB family C-S lyase [Psychrosphaera sp. I2R16]MBU2988078.1 PatB family C-S lyase [Psychrosphaera sp. B3R10]
MSFDQLIDRRSTFSFKWERYKGKDILPLWVADSEFKCAQPIIDALHARTEHGVYGYHLPVEYEPANQAVVRWLADKHDWQIEPQWIVWTPGVVPAFNVACKANCEPGDKVLVQVPNYPPMLAAPGLNQLIREDVQTIEQDGRWTLDFEQLEQKAADPKTKLFIMCNPMNPTGSVMTAEELTRVEQICLKHDVVLCSDEIHCDLILDQSKTHIPAGKLPDIGERTITLMAASKTFNVAGLGTSFAIIPDASLRRKFTQAAAGIMPWVTFMGLVATEVAFTQCDEWHQEQLDYLRGNLDYLEKEINDLDGFTFIRPEATFLAWIDASGLGVDDVHAYMESKGVGPSPGRDFGWKNFTRINFACPREMLEDAVARLKR